MTIQLKKRNEMNSETQWDLTHIFPSDQALKDAFKETDCALGALEAYRGTLSSSSDQLLNCLKHQDSLSEEVERIYVYAHMKCHEDSSDARYQAMADQADGLLVRLMSVCAFIQPEILSMETSTLRQFLLENTALSVYQHALEDLIRQKEHVLTAQMEEVLAQVQEIGQSPKNIFTMLNNADMKFGTVQNPERQTLELTHGNFISMMENPDRAFRQSVFSTYYASYEKQKNTLAAIYAGAVKKDVFFARQRHFSSALEAGLSEYNIPVSVYENLIQTVHEKLHLMHRYTKLRRKRLQLSSLHMYDLYVPLIPDIHTGIPYEESCSTLLKALSVLGEDYTQTVQEAFRNGWIDVYENAGKKSGAYSWGVYGCHPYILMNYDNKIHDLFTLAHEMGHAMHSFYTWNAQPYAYSNYTIFVAEVASTVNETLLMDYLLKHTEDPAMRAYLVNYSLEQFRTTLFRQTMFAEFEMKTHAMIEQGQSLTAESLSSLYRNLNEQYYGPDMVIDPQIDLEWARIPHFYTPFYVYQYATGYSAAVALSRKMLDEGNTAVQQYRTFLASGSKDYSIPLLRAAGVDLSSPEPIVLALNQFENLIKEMEEIQ